MTAISRPGHAPALGELPPPPSGRTGWPWTVTASPLPPVRSDGSPWPRVSVVTPSFNQAEFLEETIRSVLLQGYPDLEYVIVDGGSHDGSLDIIRKYAGNLTHWSSGPDRGQSHAINNGFARCTGSIWAWLASDDVYLAGTVARVAEVLGRKGGPRLAYGSAQFVDAQGQPLGPYVGKPLRKGSRRMQYWNGWDVPQPTLFLDRGLVEEYGGLDETLHYALDYEWVIRVTKQVEPECLPETLALYRMHGRSKTGDWQSRKSLFFAEMAKVNLRHAPPWRPRAWPLWASWLGYVAASRVRWLVSRGAGLVRWGLAAARLR